MAVERKGLARSSGLLSTGCAIEEDQPRARADTPRHPSQCLPFKGEHCRFEGVAFVSAGRVRSGVVQRAFQRALTLCLGVVLLSAGPAPESRTTEATSRRGIAQRPCL